MTDTKTLRDEPPIFDSRDRARRLLQSWTNAIAQSPEDDRFALAVTILRKAPGHEPEVFTIETNA